MNKLIESFDLTTKARNITIKANTLRVHDQVRVITGTPNAWYTQVIISTQLFF